LSDWDEECLRQAIRLAAENAGLEREGGGPFGAVIAADGVVLCSGANHVTRHFDPTAHAEVEAIREACRLIRNPSLAGYTLYSSCEPCPMCLASALWARVDRIVYASGREDAAKAGFDDEAFYREVARPPSERATPCVQGLRELGWQAFEAWNANAMKKPY